MAAAGAHILWTRLDEVNPVGPADPEEGGSMEVIEMARRGREAVKLAIEISVGRSQEYWRSKHGSNCLMAERLWNYTKSTIMQ